MEPWLLIVIIVVGVAIQVALLKAAYDVGEVEGMLKGQDMERHYNFRLTSRPTQKSGASTPERGSDDTG